MKAFGKTFRNQIIRCEDGDIFMACLFVNCRFTKGAGRVTISHCMFCGDERLDILLKHMELVRETVYQNN